MSTDCGRCGFPVSRSSRIRSKFTGVYYCADPTSCARRAHNDLSDEEMSVLAHRALKGVGV